MKKLTLKQVIALSLTVILLTAICAFSAITIINLFNKNDNDLITTPKNDVTDENGNSLESGNVYTMPSRMLFSTPSTLSGGITINATIKPETATDKTVDWSVSFAESSGWSSDKDISNFLTVIPNSDGSTTATINCLAPFGTKILVTCTSRQNSDATASMTVDYYKRIESLSVTSDYNGSSYGDNSKITWSFDGSSASNNLILPKFKEIGAYGDNSYMHFSDGSTNITWGIGTVTPEVSEYISYIKYSTNFANEITKQGISTNTEWALISKNSSKFVGLDPYFLTRIKFSQRVYSMASKEYVNQYTMALRATNGNIGELKLIIKYANNLSYEQIYNIGFSPITIGLITESITLDNVNIIL